ncbi:uncharacterized protein BYT42DRAFT_583439 [Radiomyces spectabilis]|uniref:uncharacterized protein n=1 Tax=Radiomyces spectabilis TaxID=64574 RepID=UPI00221F996E|nr:uncharacterized protein BYT42DRAFT_583439 [Radiomyces spectabilis]KAI8370713.1 hypothetical protein BYT42DRAFT_583439 [Radiomyces spectabilis]
MVASCCVLCPSCRLPLVPCASLLLVAPCACPVVCCPPVAVLFGILFPQCFSPSLFFAVLLAILSAFLWCSVSLAGRSWSDFVGFFFSVALGGLCCLAFGAATFFWPGLLFGPFFWAGSFPGRFHDHSLRPFSRASSLWGPFSDGRLFFRPPFLGGLSMDNFPPARFPCVALSLGPLPLCDLFSGHLSRRPFLGYFLIGPFLGVTSPMVAFSRSIFSPVLSDVPWRTFFLDRFRRDLSCRWHFLRPPFRRPFLWAIIPAGRFPAWPKRRATFPVALPLTVFFSTASL